MKQLNEKELAVFCGFAVLGAPDPISGEVSVTFEERKALYRALRIDHFEVSKDEFEAIEAMYDEGLVTIDAAAENLKTKKTAVQAKIYKAVYNSVKALAGGNEEKMARGDRRGSLDELKEKLGLSEEDIKSAVSHSHAHSHHSPVKKESNHSSSEPKKGSKKGLMVVAVLLVIVASGAYWYLKIKH